VDRGSEWVPVYFLPLPGFFGTPALSLDPQLSFSRTLSLPSTAAASTAECGLQAMLEGVVVGVAQRYVGTSPLREASWPAMSARSQARILCSVLVVARFAIL
jgi:hypothetical protein